MKQQILVADESYKELDVFFKHKNQKTIFMVKDNAFPFLRIREYFNRLAQSKDVNIVEFDHFTPNPSYESVVEGIEAFNRYSCDGIVAVGGGSAIDVAKCIKLFNGLNPKENYLSQIPIKNNIPFLAIPTTAGTGSEATRYAVIYYKGEKQSISDESCIPSAVLFDASLLFSLPEYQRKSTMLDALCHAVESFWSVNSTLESENYATDAIRMIFENNKAYLANEYNGNSNMLKAANLSGKAINITQTTAGHAMCYKLTSLYGIAHGHAAALCVSKLWPYMLDHLEDCIDFRGVEYLRETFHRLATAMECNTPYEAMEKFNFFLDNLNLKTPEIRGKEDLEILSQSVNPVRLRNNPVRLDGAAIKKLYHQILNI